MNEYESLFILNPEKENSLQEVTAGITEGITKNDGAIRKEENWGKRRLAYPMKKNSEGIYYKLDFSIDPSKIEALNSNYKLNPNILRVIITKK